MHGEGSAKALLSSLPPPCTGPLSGPEGAQPCVTSGAGAPHTGAQLSCAESSTQPRLPPAPGTPSPTPLRLRPHGALPPPQAQVTPRHPRPSPGGPSQGTGVVGLTSALCLSQSASQLRDSVLALLGQRQGRTTWCSQQPSGAQGAGCREAEGQGLFGGTCCQLHQLEPAGSACPAAGVSRGTEGAPQGEEGIPGFPSGRRLSIHTGTGLSGILS